MRFKVSTDFRVERVEMGGEANHVHLLLDDPAKHSISALANGLQGVSNGMLRMERPDPWRRYRRTLVAAVACCQLWRRSRQHSQGDLEQQKTPLEHLRGLISPR
jgi:REP element-mobilizing transposase RayT